MERVRKYGLLIISIMLFIASFAEAWYSDTLFDRLFVLYLPIPIILFGCFITLLAANIIQIAKYKEYINFISIGILALLVVVILFFPFRYAKAKVEVELFDAKRMEVIEMINSGVLKPRCGNNYTLPDGYGMLSSDGDLYAHYYDEDAQVIGFWVYRGLLSGSVQVIYSTGGENLIRDHTQTHEISKIEKLKKDWYYVEMNMDYLE